VNLGRIEPSLKRATQFGAMTDAIVRHMFGLAQQIHDNRTDKQISVSKVKIDAANLVLDS